MLVMTTKVFAALALEVYSSVDKGRHTKAGGVVVDALKVLEQKVHEEEEQDER
jgi:hypothetical protein